jgi:hypothetical protein
VRQEGWAYPDGETDGREYNAGGLAAVTAGGRVLLAGMYCDEDGGNRVDLRDAATGEVLSAYRHYKEWWNEPSRHFTAFRRDGRDWILYVRPRWGYVVEEVTAAGLRRAGHDPTENEVVSSLAPAVLGGRPAILVGDTAGAVYRDWQDADRILRTWRVPPGWVYPSVVSAGGRSYGWLSWDVPDSTPFADRWKVAAAHGSLLWDVTADAPAGAPLLVRGYQWGPWDLDSRPVVLFKVDWRDFQAWDIARREPLGPALGDLDLANPSVGLLYGRPALAATTGASLLVWDLGTARLLGETVLPGQPIATAIGAGTTAWAITRTGHVASLTITAAQIHPSARRARQR